MNEVINYDENESLEEKIELIKKNFEETKRLSQELSPSDSKAIAQVFTSLTVEEEKPKERTIVPFDPKFSALAKSVLNSSSDAAMDVLSSSISKSDPSYDRYIDLLKISAYKDMVEASNMAYESGDIQNSELKEMYNEAKAILYTIENAQEEEEDLTQAVPPKEGNVLFFRTSSNRVCVYEEIDKVIPTDQYSQIMELMGNLSTGNYQGRFKPLTNKKGMYELKLGQIRIIFGKICGNKFLVLDIFLKKFNSSKDYRERLDRIESNYNLEKDYYLLHCDDPDLIEENQTYFQDIITLCETKGRGR